MQTLQAFLDGQQVGKRTTDRPYVWALVLTDFDLDAALASAAKSEHKDWYTRYYTGCAAKGTVVVSWHMSDSAANRALAAKERGFYRRITLVPAIVKPQTKRAKAEASNVG